MGGRAPRLTHSLEAVLDAVMAAPADDPAYGLRICEETSLGPGTVYPVLERLVGYGWVETWQEPEQPSGRPRRPLFRVTRGGRPESPGCPASPAPSPSRPATRAPPAASAGQALPADWGASASRLSWRGTNDD